MKQRRCEFMILSITAFIFSACASAGSNHNQTPQVQASKAPLQAAGGDPLGCIEKDQGNPAGLKKAWRSFLADGRYRIAREDDFSLPDTPIAKRLHGRTVCPVDPGDFNHDGKWYDLAVIIVDTTRVGSDRFGLVIFNRQKNDDEPYVPYWLYNTRDLSKSVLNGLKDDLAVSELSEDGSMLSCHVKWDIKQNSYSCGKPLRNNYTK